VGADITGGIISNIIDNIIQFEQGIGKMVNIAFKFAFDTNNPIDKGEIILFFNIKKN
jgi:hypothetical protein